MRGSVNCGAGRLLAAAALACVAALASAGPSVARAAPGQELLVLPGWYQIVDRFDANTGVFLGELVHMEDTHGSNAFHKMTLGPDGLLYVTDVLPTSLSTGILVLNPGTGEVVRQFDRVDGAWPNDITFGPDGDVYVSVIPSLEGRTVGHVWRFGATGAFKGEFAHDVGFGSLSWEADGNLYMSRGYGLSDVLVLDGTTGALLRTLRTAETTSATSHGFGSDGLLYVADDQQAEIDVYDPSDMSFVKSIRHEGMIFPTNVQFESDGMLYVSDPFSRSIHRYDIRTGLVQTIVAESPEMVYPTDVVLFTRAIPEPSTLGLLLAGIAMLASVARRREARAMGKARFASTATSIRDLARSAGR